MSAIKDKEYISLMEKLLDESISNEELDQLRNKLETIPGLFEDYISTMDFHEDLNSYWAYQTDISTGVIEESKDKIKLQKRQRVTRYRRHSPGRSRGVSSVNVWLSVAALLAIAVGLKFYFNQPEPPKPSVTLLSEENAVKKQAITIAYKFVSQGATVNFEELLADKKGDEVAYLEEGNTITVPSDKECYLLFPGDKTSMALAPKSKMGLYATLNGPKIKLFQGSLSADITKQPEGRFMSFETLKVDAQIIGTKIKVDAIGNNTYFHVYEGLVKVVDKLKKETLTLAENQAVELTPESKFEIKPSSEVVKNKIKAAQGLELWLDASDKSSFILDGNKVKAWKDKSPSKHLVTQSKASFQPSLDEVAVNGMPAVHFDASKSQFLQLGDVESRASSWTYFIVLKTGIKQKDVKILGGKNEYQIGISEGRYYYTELSLGRPTFTADPGDVELVTFVLDKKNDQSLVYKDGQFKNRYEDFAGERWLKARLSGDGVDAKTNFDGDIAEIIVFNRALSDLDRQEIDRYLKLKWLNFKY